jgi:hypothetical protein
MPICVDAEGPEISGAGERGTRGVDGGLERSVVLARDLVPLGALRRSPRAVLRRALQARAGDRDEAVASDPRGARVLADDVHPRLDHERAEMQARVDPRELRGGRSARRDAAAAATGGSEGAADEPAVVRGLREAREHALAVERDELREARGGQRFAHQRRERPRVHRAEHAHVRRFDWKRSRGGEQRFRARSRAPSEPGETARGVRIVRGELRLGHDDVAGSDERSEEPAALARDDLAQMARRLVAPRRLELVLGVEIEHPRPRRLAHGLLRNFVGGSTSRRSRNASS